MTLKEALMAMGYRPMNKEIWAKPIAYHLLAVKLNEETISNYFIGVNGQLLTWDSHQLEGRDYLAELKMYEWTTRFDVGQPYQATKNLAFLTKEQEFEGVL